MASQRSGKTLPNSNKQQQNNAKKILADEKAAEKACVTEMYSGLRIR